MIIIIKGDKDNDQYSMSTRININLVNYFRLRI